MEKTDGRLEKRPSVFSMRRNFAGEDQTSMMTGRIIGERFVFW